MCLKQLVFLEVLMSMESLFQSFSPKKVIDLIVTFSVTVAQYRFIRIRYSFDFALANRGKHLIHVLLRKLIMLFKDMSYNVLFKSSSNWKPIYFLKLINPNVRSVSQGQAKSNELVLANFKIV